MRNRTFHFNGHKYILEKGTSEETGNPTVDLATFSQGEGMKLTISIPCGTEEGRDRLYNDFTPENAKQLYFSMKDTLPPLFEAFEEYQ